MEVSFFREQNYYKFYELRDDYLKVSEDECKKVIRILKKYGIVKSVDRNKPEFEDLSDSDDVLSDVTDNPDSAYKFCFVGVILVRNSVICCYPKYIDNNNSPMKEMKTVLEVIRKYKSDSQESVHLYNGNGTDEKNDFFYELKVSLYLLYDYFENGIYSNEQTIIETNGEGEIQWDKTINETFAILKRNTPYYIDLQTITNRTDEQEYFKLLHECILTSCSNKLAKAGLLDLFDISPVQLSDREIDDFGDKEYIKYRLEREIQIQYVTKKQILLKTLKTYISESKENDEISDSVSLYGTNSFNLVWEKICAEVFDNQLQTQIGDLPIPLAGKYSGMKDKKLIELIEKPLWKGIGANKKEFSKEAEDTLKPDLISIKEVNGSYQFIIFDAKYYNLQLDEDRLSGQPGIESITKQYLYQLAYKPFTDANNITTVMNCFLLPTVSEEIIDKGTVSLAMLSNLNLQDIQVRLLPAETMYRHYISNTKMEIESLKLDPNNKGGAT